MPNSRLAVIIVTYNSLQEIDPCLSSLFADLNGQPVEVVIVDNASPDGTAAHIAKRWPRVRLLAQTENRGFAVANNIGLAAIQGDPVLLLNPDTQIQYGALAALQNALDAHPEAGVAGPMLLNPDGSFQPSCRDFPTLFGDFIAMTELYRLKAVRLILGRRMVGFSAACSPRRVDWLSGACLLFRRQAINTVGPMDEAFFLYSEEMEWQYRMARYGWFAWYEPAARVIHQGGASTARVPGERILWQYQSIFRFYRLHRSYLQRLALRWIVWGATWPKILLLALLSRGSTRRRQVLHAFWQVLWIH